MLSAEAMRLAALEVLAPTAARIGEVGATFPTLAGHRVYDSRPVAVSELNDEDERGYTPVISLYSSESRLERRGAAAAAWDNDCEAALEIVAELAVVVQPDDGEDDEPFVDALAATDGEARLVLAALVAQIRFLLEFSEPGHIFRAVTMGVRRIEERTMALPELGLRWHRVLMTITAAARNDDFEDTAGLPEPLKSLDAMLPAGSIAKAKLAQLAASFAGQPRTPLEIVTTSDPRGVWPSLGIDIPND